MDKINTDNYTLVNKTFLNKLLMSNINPMMYITKALTKKEQKVMAMIEDMMEEQLQESKKWLSSEEARQLAAQSTAQRAEAFDKLQDQMNGIVNDKADSVEEMMNKFYSEGAKKGCEQLGKNVVFTLADQQALYSIHQYDFDLIREISNDVTDKIRSEIWRGVGEGSSIPEIKDRLNNVPIEPLNVNGRVLTPKQRAEMIARTEVSRARNAGSVQAYANYGVELVDVICTDDDRCCDDCLSISEGGPYNLADVSNLIPYHPNCRCSVAPHVLGDETANELPEGISDPAEVVDLTTSDTEENQVISNEEISEDELFNTDNASSDDTPTDDEYSKEDLVVQLLDGDIGIGDLYDEAKIGDVDEIAYAAHQLGEETPLPTALYEKDDEFYTNADQLAENVSNDLTNEYVLPETDNEKLSIEEIDSDSIVAPQDVESEEYVPNTDLPEEIGQVIENPVTVDETVDDDNLQLKSDLCVQLADGETNLKEIKDEVSPEEARNIEYAKGILTGVFDVDVVGKHYPDDIEDMMKIVYTVSSDKTNDYFYNVTPADIGQEPVIPENGNINQYISDINGLDTESIANDLANNNIDPIDLDGNINEAQADSIVENLYSTNMDTETVNEVSEDLHENAIPTEINVNSIINFDKEFNFSDDFDDDKERLAGYFKDNPTTSLLNIEMSDQQLHDFVEENGNLGVPFKIDPDYEGNNKELNILSEELSYVPSGMLDEAAIDNWDLLDNKCESEIGALIEENGEVLNHLEDVNILQDPENYPAYEFYSNELENGDCEFFDVQNNLNDHDLALFCTTNEVAGYDENGNFDWSSVSKNFDTVLDSALSGIPLSEHNINTLTEADLNGLRESFKSFDFRDGARPSDEEVFSNVNDISYLKDNPDDKDSLESLQHYSYGFDGDMNKYCNLSEEEFREYAEDETQSWIDGKDDIEDTDENFEYYTQAFIDDIQNNVDNASNFIENDEILEPIITYRGNGSDLHLDDDELGSITRIEQFNSTSIDYDTAQGFGDYKLEVLNPAGSGATYIEPVSEVKGEREVLIDKGTDYQLLSINEANSSATVLRILR